MFKLTKTIVDVHHRLRRGLILLVELASAVMAGISSAATPPNLMNYQGYLADATGHPLSGNYAIAFSL